MVSKWQQFGMEAKIRKILSNSKYNTDHHFLRPFLTPYQIGIMLVQEYANLLLDLRMKFGGKRTDKKNDLTDAR